MPNPEQDIFDYKKYNQQLIRPAQINTTGNSSLRFPELNYPTPQIKINFMKEMGFSQRSFAVWYHPSMLKDEEKYWLDFDPNTDTLSQLFIKLHKLGYVEGRNSLKEEIEKLWAK